MAISGLLAAPAIAAEECEPRTVAVDSVGSLADDAACSPAGSIVVVDEETGRYMQVPESGILVRSHAVTEEGGEAIPDVELFHSDGGEVAVAIEDDLYGTPSAIEDLEAASESLTVGSSSPTTNKCSTGAPYKLDGHIWKFTKTYEYWYNSAGAPSGASDAIALGAKAIAGGESSTCGTRSNGLNIYRGGTTTTYAGITAGASCQSVSGKSEVSFGPITKSDTLALACTWLGLNGFVEADIKFDNSSRTWNTANTCTGAKIDLRGVATHEFGHAVGLEHVVQNSGQVLAPYTSNCNTSQRQLGRGDQEGLRAMYGVS
ncbi:matrixin family metalloprotease [Microbacterium sp.]|uniref:matrixin family metalloprotease n=1 Tax=Microbacterium sp. TaxID=51671 RepID=UPI0039E30A07